MRAIEELGYVKPSPIQAQALPILLGDPTDFLGLAATGTGKTAAFAIPMLERIDTNARSVQALVLCPTRELANQVAGQIELLGKYKGIKTLAVYGGAGYGDQLAGLKRGVHIVVGTPGRVLDHMERKTLRLGELQLVVLDEADEMISMGFKDDLETILGSVPPGMSNTWLFSATMSPDVRKVADKYLKSPKHVQVNRTEVLPENIEQIYYCTQESNKPEVLCKLIDAADDFYGIVFCQTKSLVQDLTQYLKGRSYSVDCLHGDMEQPARERTMQSFRDRKVSVLICTDVASRGLDVRDITHVINYSIPRELDSYVHRIGRTARSGKAGFAMSLVTPSHRGLIGRIEKMTKSRMNEGKIPTRKDIGARKVTAALTKYQAQANFARAVELMGPVWKTAIAGQSVEEVAGRFLTLMYPEVFAEPKASESNGAVVAQRAEGGGRGSDRRPEYRGGRNDRRDGGGRDSRGGWGRGGKPSGDRGRSSDRGDRSDRGPRAIVGSGDRVSASAGPDSGGAGPVVTGAKRKSWGSKDGGSKPHKVSKAGNSWHR